MLQVDNPYNPEKEEQKYLESIAQLTKQTIEAIKSSGIFDESYLADARIAFPSNSRQNVVYYQEETSYDTENKFNDVRGFEIGLRTDFIALEPKEEYEVAQMQMTEGQRIQELFYSSGIPYSEFAAHETAHNIFDKAYVKTCGDYEVFEQRDPNSQEIKGLVTECSETYRDKIASELNMLFSEYNINLNASQFLGDEENNRQKISEIFALLVQREFSKRTNQKYFQEHQSVEGRVREFLADPDKAMLAYSHQTGRNVTLQDFYKENHILSFVTVPLLEKKFKSFEERVKFLGLETKGLLKI